MRQTLVFLSVFFITFSVAHTQSYNIECAPGTECSVQHSCPAYSPPSPIGNVNMVVIYAVPLNPPPPEYYFYPDTTLPPWYNNISNATTGMANFFQTASDGQHNLSISLLVNGDRPFRASVDLASGPSVYQNITSTFVTSVLTAADSIYDFGQFDNDGPDGIPNSGDDDGYVDFVSFHVIWPNGRGGIGLPLSNCWASSDSSNAQGVDFIRVSGRHDAALQQIIYQAAHNLAIPLHEYGHSMAGLPDMDHSYLTDYNHYSLGGFEAMAGGGFNGVSSVYNPWFRDELLQWITPTSISQDSASYQMSDLLNTGIVLKRTPSTPANALPNEKFYVSYHTGANTWEAQWPVSKTAQGGTGGVLIWHVTAGGAYSDWRRQPVDIEAAHGKFVWSENATSVTNTGVPDPIAGRDSLEVRKIGTSNKEIQGPYFGKDRGSASVFFLPNSTGSFSHASNPNSNFYTLSSPYGQSVNSGFAVRNIVRSGGVTRADFLIDEYPPAAPTLTAPANGATVIVPTDVPFVAWDPVVGATAYEFQISVDPNFTGAPIRVIPGEETWALTTALQFSTTYNWHVRAKNDVGTSDWSETYSFTTSIGPPVNIGVQIYGISIKVDGQNYTGAQQFVWEPTTQHEICAITPQYEEIDSRFIFVSWSDGGDTCHTFTTTTEDTTLSVIMKKQYRLTSNTTIGGTVNPLGQSWRDSNAVVNLTASPVQGYLFAGWSGNVTGMNNPVSLTMNAAKTVTANFELENPPEPVPVTVQTNPAGRSFTVDGNTYTSAQVFDWMSGTERSLGTTSPQDTTSSARHRYGSWSDSGEQTHTITISPSTTSYTVNFIKQFTLTVTAGAGGSVNPAGTSWRDSAASVLIQATANGGYAFSGWSGDLTGTNNPKSIVVNSPKTVTANFVAAPPPTPTLVSPSNNATGVSASPMLVWSYASGATSYTVQWSTNSNFSSAVDSATVDSTSYQVTGLINGTSYYWRVKGTNDIGSSNWSTVRTFTTAPPPPQAPTLAVPSNGTIKLPTSVTVSWNSVSTANSYGLQVSTDGTFTNVIVNQSGMTSTSYTVENLSSSTQYWWRVNASNTNGTGNWSAAWSFSTGTFVPAPVLYTPANGNVNADVSNAFHWEPIGVASFYKLQVSLDSLFLTSLVVDSITSGPNNYIPVYNKFGHATDYYWRVYAENSTGRSIWTPTWKFRVKTVVDEDAFWSGTVIPQQVVTINNGATLTVLPGTIVNFVQGAALVVNGRLRANGTAAQRITFDGAGYVPSQTLPQYWKLAMLRLRCNSIVNETSITYSNIRNANYQVYVDSTSAWPVRISNNIFSNFAYRIPSNYAVKVSKNMLPTGSVTVDSNTFYGGASPGVSEGGNAIVVESGWATMRNNAITKCRTGIQSYSSNMMIQNNTIDSCTYYGIYSNIQSYNGSQYLYNHLRYNNYGIFLNAASGLLRSNRISLNSGPGVYMNNQSNPKFGTGELQGLNVMRANGGAGLSAANYSNPWLGYTIWEGQNEEGEWFYEYEGAFNSIYLNQGPGVSAVNNCLITAHGNYWGNSTFSITGGSTLSTYAPLSSDPNNGQYLRYAGTGSSVSTNEISFSRANSNSLTSSVDIDTLLNRAVRLSLKREFVESKNILKSLMDSRAGSQTGIYALMLFCDIIEQEMMVDSLKIKHSILKNELETLLYLLKAKQDNYALRPLALRALSRLEVMDRNFEQALALDNEVLSKYSNTDHEKTALYDLLSYYVYVEHNYEKAKTYLATLKAKYPDDDLTTFGMIAVGEPVDMTKRMIRSEPTQQTNMAEEAATASEGITGLGSNYPNPFNPATSISFELAADTHVKLVVYDILGREVAKLVDEPRIAGKYQAVFDANKLPSGVYFYRLNAGSYAAVRSMVLVK